MVSQKAIVLTLAVLICFVCSEQVPSAKKSLIVPETAAGVITNETAGNIETQNNMPVHTPIPSASILPVKGHLEPWTRIKRSPAGIAQRNRAMRANAARREQAWRRKVQQACVAKLRKTLYHKYHGKHHHDVAWRRKEQQCKNAWRRLKPKPKSRAKPRRKYQPKPKPRPAPAPVPAPIPVPLPGQYPVKTPDLKPTYPDINKNQNQEPFEVSPKQQSKGLNLDVKVPIDKSQQGQLKRNIVILPPPFIKVEDDYPDIDAF